MTEFEQRGATLGFEARAANDKKTLVGYAALFNVEANIGDMFIEKVAPGAFDQSLAADVRALVDHDTGRIIGRTKSGTLRLATDDRGLRIEIDVPDTNEGRDLWTLVDRGDVSGMSIGFRVTKQEWDDSGDISKRTILGIDLHEVSAVAFPAFEGTSIAVRSLEAARAELDAVKADKEKRASDAAAARRRLAERTARQEQKIRGIRQDAT